MSISLSLLQAYGNWLPQNVLVLVPLGSVTALLCFPKVIVMLYLLMLFIAFVMLIKFLLYVYCMLLCGNQTNIVYHVNSLHLG